MVIAAGRLDEVVPLEPAAMPGRVVVQWDKDDCADLGIIKVDLLGLGMLNALEEVMPIIRTPRRRATSTSPTCRPTTPRSTACCRRPTPSASSRSRAARRWRRCRATRPTRFYDLVIQVAIIRPGPIAGGMAHPFFERRRAAQPVTYPHPSLEPILERTLGVPIFQEQLLRIAMVAAGFTGGEAEELRRAMGFKRSVERMNRIEAAPARGHDRARHHRQGAGRRSSSRSPPSRSTASPSRTPRASR